MKKQAPSQPGSFTHQMVGRVLVTQLVGPWGREDMINWQDQSGTEVSRLAKRGLYATLMQITQSILCAPSALALLRTQVQDLVHHSSLVCAAIVASREVEGRGVAEQTYAEVYAGLCPFRFFETESEAMQWIEHMLDASQRAQPARSDNSRSEAQLQEQRHREAARLHRRLARLHMSIADWEERGEFDAAQQAMAQVAHMNSRASELTRPA